MGFCLGIDGGTVMNGFLHSPKLDIAPEKIASQQGKEGIVFQPSISIGKLAVRFRKGMYLWRCKHINFSFGKTQTTGGVMSHESNDPDLHNRHKKLILKAITTWSLTVRRLKSIPFQGPHLEVGGKKPIKEPATMTPWKIA